MRPPPSSSPSSSPSLPLSLPASVYLLAYDRDRDRLAGGRWLGYALRAAALADLLAAGDLVERDGRLRATPHRSPPADPVLRGVLAEVADRPRTWRQLIARGRRSLENAVVAQLDAEGRIRVERPATWWRPARIDLRDRLGLTRCSERVASVLRGPVPPDRLPAGDVCLVAILAVAGIRTGINGRQRREYGDRIAAVTAAAGAPAAALRHAIRAARLATSS